MSEQGYVRVYRTLLGHPAFRNDGEAMAFAWMVLRASWRPARVRYKGMAVSLERGQLAVSVRDLAEALDRSKGWVERLLTRLKSETMIETHSETGVTVVTICNYAEYQAEQDSPGTPRGTAAGTKPGQRRDTEQRREKGNKEITLDASASNAASAATDAPHSDDQNPGDEKGKSSTTHPPAEPEPDPPRLTAKDITKVIFDSGIALLVGAGCREPQARSIIGRWRKEYHDSIVLAALSRAQAQDDISQPIEWMTRALIRERQRAAGENHGPVPPTRPSLVDIGRAVADDLRAERGLP